MKHRRTEHNRRKDDIPAYILANTDQTRLYEVIRNQRAKIILLEEELRQLRESFPAE